MALIRRILTEPLFQFLLIGAAIFGLYTVTNPPSRQPSENEIVLSDGFVDSLREQFQAVWRRPPTPDELENLIESGLREEVFVRQAIALSLDQNDAVIRQRLAQKMQFLIDSAAAALTPTDAELAAFFAENIADYTPAPRLGFEQVYLGERATQADADAALAALTSGAVPGDVGLRTQLPPAVPPSPRLTVDGIFGRGFFDHVAGAPDGVWTGPVQSGFGLHLVRVLDRISPAPPDLEPVRERVVADWRRQRTDDLSEAQYQRMLSSYSVVRPTGSGQ